MQEHPVPQNVTSYEFHLIGNMTLKQFLELSAGCVLGLVVYSTNLPGVIKWPLIILAVAIGAFAAFVPFEGRPLDQWFYAFIKAIYRPTEFYWKKSEEIPDYFTFTVTTKHVEAEFDLSPYKQQRIKEYISSLPAEAELAPLDALEQQRLGSVMTLFQQVTVDQVQVTAKTEKPDLTSQVRTLQPLQHLVQTEQTLPASETQVVQSANPTSEPQLNTTIIPQSATIATDKSYAEEQQKLSVASLPQQSDTVQVFSSSSQDFTAPITTQQAQTSDALPFPQKPTQPNVIVGMVFDSQGNSVDNAIVEITDTNGMPVRAVKTNLVGQFFITTPLNNGNYFINIEKAGSTFPTIELALENTLVDPLDIRASA